jgi:hypothetical protein
MSTCPKSYFTVNSRLIFRSVNINFDVSTLPATCNIEVINPFLPLAWLKGDGTGRYISLASENSQVKYFPTLQATLRQMWIANFEYPNPSYLGVQYNGRIYPNYINKYWGESTPPYGVTLPSWAVLNQDATTFPLGIVDSFWQDEALTPDPPTLMTRLENLAEWLTKNTDLRLWVPPGLYTNIPADPGLSKSLDSAFNDPDVGQGSGLSFWGIELITVE